MPAYDEKAIRKRFAGAAFMRRFSITKRRLYETVLASLDAFHADSSIDDKLRRMLHHVELLHRRALYADAVKVLRGARTLARAHDRQALLLQVAEWERRAMERCNYSGVTAADLATRAGSVAGVADEWQEVDRLWQIKSASSQRLIEAAKHPARRSWSNWRLWHKNRCWRTGPSCTAHAHGSCTITCAAPWLTRRTTWPLANNNWPPAPTC